MRKNLLTIFLFGLFVIESIADSFQYNTFNNHGVIGLVNMPSARFYDEASYGFTFYNGSPDQKLTMTSFYKILKNRIMIMLTLKYMKERIFSSNVIFIIY